MKLEEVSRIGVRGNANEMFARKTSVVVLQSRARSTSVFHQRCRLNRMTAVEC